MGLLGSNLGSNPLGGNPGGNLGNNRIVGRTFGKPGSLPDMGTIGGAGSLLGGKAIPPRDPNAEYDWSSLPIGGNFPSLQSLLTSPFESRGIQSLLPYSLQYRNTGDMLNNAIQEIGKLLASPGSTSENLSGNIAERLASDNAVIGQNYSNMAAEQSGAAARGNVPVSIKGALQRALETNERRARGDTMRGAISESEAKRREDLQQAYNVLDMILQFLSSARGQAVQGTNAAEAISSQNSAADMASISALLQAIGEGMSVED